MKIKTMTLAIFLSFAIVFVSATISAQELPFEPTCTYYQNPVGVGLTGWEEGFDGSNLQEYCLYNSTVFYIRQSVFSNFDGEYYTKVNSDLWKNLNLVETGNVRDVEVQITYYEPTYEGKYGPACMSQIIGIETGGYTSPQKTLLANHQGGFSGAVTFDDALYNLNPIMGCDQWNTIQVTVSDFSNDWGSSFAGHSKTIGTFGLEMKNVYISSIKVIGTEETITLW